MKSDLLLAAATLASALALTAANARDAFAPDITNGDAYRNNAIIG